MDKKIYIIVRNASHGRKLVEKLDERLFDLEVAIATWAEKVLDGFAKGMDLDRWHAKNHALAVRERRMLKMQRNLVARHWLVHPDYQLKENMAYGFEAEAGKRIIAMLEKAGKTHLGVGEGDAHLSHD